MSLWTAAEAEAATGGSATSDWTATGVSIDTRTLEPGDLFVALKAARDGHDFVAQALEQGAAAAMVDHVPEGVSETAPLLLVDDVQRALEGLGQAGRARARARVVAVTGSVGKTSTKDMLHHVLRTQGKTHAAVASYNNHWGVPLTLARLPQDADYAVIEIGMNHPGEIAPLARMARPQVALVTTVAAAHLAAFASLAGIAREKASIFEGLEPGGTAILNGDLDTSPVLREAAEKHAETIVSFGAKPGNAYRITRVDLHDATTVAHATADGAPLLYKIGAAGRHFAENALAVLAAVRALGADPAIAIADLGTWRPPGGRGTREVLHLDAADETLTVDLIDDAFNANPTSMAAALEVLAAAQATGRRIAILGDMLELGPDETALHAGLAGLPQMGKIDSVHCVGPRMRALWQALPQARRGEWVATADELVHRAHRLIGTGDVVLVKGSKGSLVSRVVTALRNASRETRREEEGL